MCFTQVIAQSTAQVGRSPWQARDAFVPLPEAEASSPGGPGCQPHEILLARTHLSQAHTQPSN